MSTRCETCGELPDVLTVNTGRDEQFPDAFDRLKRRGLDRDVDVSWCPACGALFEWRNTPQFYGSGNLDEESLARLTPSAAVTLERLLGGDVGPDPSAFVRSAFTDLSSTLLPAVLAHVQRARLEQFEQLLPSLVERFVDQRRDPTERKELYALLSSFMQGKPTRERCSRLAGLLRNHALEGSAQYLLKLCETELARAL